MCIAGFSHFESNPGLLLVPPQIKTSWVGVNSRWGSIVSISVFDWGSIRFCLGWESNQEWGSIRADTVVLILNNCISRCIGGVPVITSRPLVGALLAIGARS